MIGAFVAESWVAHPAARDVLVPVAAGNRASWRALERAGFTRIAEGPMEPDNPIDPPTTSCTGSCGRRRDRGLPSGNAGSPGRFVKWS